jgi:hypothetical protein
LPFGVILSSGFFIQIFRNKEQYMTREELFTWAADNTRKYPALDRFCEVMINSTVFLFLPGEYGSYKGLYLCFSKNPAFYSLRREGYAVGLINSYTTARKLLLECVRYTKRQERKRKKDAERK